MGQCVKLYFSYHLNHSGYQLLPLYHIQFERFAVLLSFVVVARCFTPHLFALVELSNFKMFLHIFIIVLKHNFSVLVHFLM